MIAFPSLNYNTSESAMDRLVVSMYKSVYVA
jgi:hypothetical protein